MENKGQMSVELVVVASIMVFLLLIIYIANDSLSSSWERQKQKLEASAAASRLALAVDRVSMLGNGSSLLFFNSASTDVTSMAVEQNSSILASTISGVSSIAPMVCSRVGASGEIPVNQDIIIRNSNGLITIEAA